MSLADSHTFSLLSQLLTCSSLFDSGRLLAELDSCHVEVFRALLLGHTAGVDGLLTNVLASDSPSTPIVVAGSPVSPSSSSTLSPSSSPRSAALSRASSSDDSGGFSSRGALLPPLYVLQLCTPSLLHSRPALWETASLAVLSRLEDELQECQQRCTDVSAVKLHRLCVQSLRQWRQQRPFLSRPMELEALQRLTSFLSPIHRDILAAVRQPPVSSTPHSELSSHAPLLPFSSPLHRADEPHLVPSIGCVKGATMSGDADAEYLTAQGVTFDFSYTVSGPQSMAFPSPSFLASPCLSTSSSSSSSNYSPSSSTEGVDHFDLDLSDPSPHNEEVFTLRQPLTWPSLSSPSGHSRTLSSPPASFCLSMTASSSALCSPALSQSVEERRSAGPKAIFPSLATAVQPAPFSSCLPSRRRRRSTDLSAAFSAFSASACSSPPPGKRSRSFAEPCVDPALSRFAEGGLDVNENAPSDCP